MADCSDGLADLLEQQKALRRKAKSRKGQKITPEMKRSRQELEREFIQRGLQSDMRQMAGEEPGTGTTFIGEAYTPCVKALADLTPIRIQDLTLETHHRGTVLNVTTICEPERSTCVLNAVEDENGDVAHLSFYNVPLSVSPDQVLPKGAAVAVKEPYCEYIADDSIRIRVDHPSDLVILKFEDEEASAGLDAEALKDRGNVAFKKQDWLAAVRCYTDAVEACGEGDEQLLRAINRNRSLVNTNLGRFDPARDDALNGVIPGDNLSATDKAQNVKAFYRAGRAAYELRDFDRARQHYKQALALQPDDGDTMKQLERTEKRLEEQEHGNYDLAAMSKSASKSHSRLDHASYLTNTRPASAGHRGRGLFATKTLEPGDIVLVEKAFHITFEDDKRRNCSLLVNLESNRASMGTHADRLCGIVQKMTWNPTLAKRYMQLHDGGEFEKKDVKVVDGMVPVNIFQAHAMSEFNGFGCARVRSSDAREQERTGEDLVNSSTGMWLHMAYANHQCTYNAARSFIGDMMIVRATKTIKEGDEIFLLYQDPSPDHAETQKRLKEAYGFSCDCVHCAAEAKVSAAAQKKRASLCNDAAAFISSNAPGRISHTASSMLMRRATQMHKNIAATYEGEVFDTLPRKGLVDLDMWLCQTHHHHMMQPADAAAQRKMVDLGLALLHDHGYMVKMEGKRVSVDRTNAIALPAATHGAMYAAKAFTAQGKKGASEALVALAKEIYECLYGELRGFDRIFGGSI